MKVSIREMMETASENRNWPDGYVEPLIVEAEKYFMERPRAELEDIVETLAARMEAKECAMLSDGTYFGPKSKQVA